MRPDEINPYKSPPSLSAEKSVTRFTFPQRISNLSIETTYPQDFVEREIEKFNQGKPVLLMHMFTVGYFQKSDFNYEVSRESLRVKIEDSRSDSHKISFLSLRLQKGYRVIEIGKFCKLVQRLSEIDSIRVVDENSIEIIDTRGVHAKITFNRESLVGHGVSWMQQELDTLIANTKELLRLLVNGQ